MSNSSRKNNFLVNHSYILFLLFLWQSSQIPAQSIKANFANTDGYNATIGRLQTNQNLKSTYTPYQLETLKQAKQPHYVTILHYNQRSSSKKLMDKGILFTYKGFQAKKVAIAGDFNNWRPKYMQRNQMGIFFSVVPLREIEEGKQINVYRYKFLVDGIWQHDALNQHREGDGLGGLLSVYHLDQREINRQTTVRILREKQGASDYLVEFAIYLPKVKTLSLVGNFNNWDPDYTSMQQQNGVYRHRLRLKAGTYIYKYIADGKWILDKFNENTHFDPLLQELCSLLILP